MKKILQNGFTLVEMLIYMGLLSIFLVTLTDIFVSVLDIKAESEATSSVEQDGRFIIERLSYDVSRASSVTQPASIGASGNTLSLVIGGVTYSYSISSNNLQLTNDLGINNLNSSESQIPSVTFQRIGNSGGKDTIKVTFVVNSVTQRRGAGAETRTFQVAVGRR